MCGEQTESKVQLAKNAGSPPRVRGTVTHYVFKHHTARITPACAGNSYCAARQREIAGDHPRVCGEQTMAMAEAAIFGGSPPRVRGTATLAVSGA